MRFGAVVDASVVLAAFIEGRQTPAAERALSLALEFVAPDLLLAEVANGLWRYVRSFPGAAERSQELIDRIPSRIRLTPSKALASSALQIACSLDHSAYDAFYLAHARNEGLPLVTLDERLLHKLRGTVYAGLALSAAEFAKRYSPLRGVKRRTPRHRPG